MPHSADLSETVRRPLVSWEFREANGDEASQLRLPHDAMLAETRGPHVPGGADTAWFPGGKYEYRTTWRPSRHDRRASAALRFEGVQGDAVVLVNGTQIGSVRGGYSECELPIGDQLDWDNDNEIQVLVDNTAQPASRWYPGSGLYREVYVVLRPPTHFASDGVRLRTVMLDSALARVEVAYSIVGGSESLTVVAELRDEDGVAAVGKSAGSDGVVSLAVASPRPWSAMDPHRYELAVRIEDDGTLLDVHRELVGLRTINVDARNGLRINGKTIKLRGACIHHDNGILGAATHRAAEFRRIRFLKDAGFNAIRSAHNPMSRALLDACDELGMYVLDEFADYWYSRKTPHDSADRFLETWRADAASLFEKDRNRPSVIMYAIGNEIPETATPRGVELARELTEYFHQNDPDRPVTVAVNLFLNTIVSMGASPYKSINDGNASENSMAGSTEANALVNHIGKMMHLAARLPQADKASRDVFGVVDVAGYNYGLARYKGDVRRYPDRIILGSETLPGDIAWAEELVQNYPAVIGDFVWAGWEYLGEAGVAVWVPGKRAGLSKPYPYIVAGPGMFDLTGRPDASLRLAQAAWGSLDQPAIAVRPLDRSGVRYVRSAWRVTDAVESWSWRGSDGRKAEIEVYSTDDEVELILNGTSLGRRAAGRRAKFVTRFTTPYRPGTLTAVGYRGGVAVSRSTLQSAGPNFGLTLTAEGPALRANGADLAYVWVEIADDQGEVEMLADDRVKLTIAGPAELVGFGTAAPATEEPFITDVQTTYRGRALAILRSTGSIGEVRISATSARRGSAVLSIDAVADTASQSSSSSASAASVDASAPASA